MVTYGHQKAVAKKPAENIVKHIQTYSWSEIVVNRPTQKKLGGNSLKASAQLNGTLDVN